MKSTVVDESLSSFKPMYCSREYQASTRLIQQYEKSTLKTCLPLEPLHTRNMYLQAQLDMCTNVNIMPASIYQLLFKDLEMKKVEACRVQISIYAADTVKIIGSCIFDVVHPDTKKLVPITFCIANNNRSVLLAMQNSSSTSIDPTTIETRLPATMS